jgi:hypothetical protein
MIINPILTECNFKTSHKSATLHSSGIKGFQQPSVEEHLVGLIDPTNCERSIRIVTFLQIKYIICIEIEFMKSTA